MPDRVHLKICGNTRVQDAKLIGESGADYCGILVDVGFSERSLSFPAARKVSQSSGIKNVILVFEPEIKLIENIAREIRPHAVQLLSGEPPEYVTQLKEKLSCQIWKSVFLPVASGKPSPEDYVSAGADALLVDAVDESEGFQRFGGTGMVSDWRTAALAVQSVSVPVFLAGGITPENVEEAVLMVRPNGIDLCSGVERMKGRKDPAKVGSLVDNFKFAVDRLARGEF